MWNIMNILKEIHGSNLVLWTNPSNQIYNTNTDKKANLFLSQKREHKAI